MKGLDVSAISSMLKTIRDEQDKKTLKIKNKDEHKRRFAKIRQRLKDNKNK